MMQLQQISRCVGVALLCVASASAQQLSGRASQLNVPQSLDQLLAAGQQSPYSGSVRSPLPPNGTLELTVDEAISRGLKYNLGLIYGGQNAEQARATRLKDLSDILPHINGSLRESKIKANLNASGIDISKLAPGYPAGARFDNSDARLSMTEDLLDFHAINNLRAAGASQRAANFNLGAARETVVLAVAASYLLVIAAESEVDATTAELETAQALYRLAEDREQAGLTPNVDTLRAHVELQVRRQNLIEANNNLAKQRITLMRVLGLPVHQPFKPTTRAPYRPLPPLTEEAAVTRALATRPDYLAVQQQVKAAELMKRSAEAEHLPSIGLAGDYGTLGTRPNNAFPTWTLTAGVQVPIFQGGKITADIRQADITLRQRQSQLEDMRGRIEQDVANAMLDVNAAAEQVEVALATLDYVHQTLTQSQDRFSAGVTNNIEVIQAQESLATANEQYIRSLYSHNIAKVLLARAMGIAEQSIHQVLGDRSAQPAPQPAGAPLGNASLPAAGGEATPAPVK